MTVIISFVQPKGIGSAHAPGIGHVRARESISVPGSTTLTAREGEVVIIGNAESSMVLAAFGTVPDAQATSANASTTAGFPIGAGAVTGGIVVNEDDKINIKALP